MDREVIKAMRLLKQEIKFAKNNEGDLLTGVLARFGELETVVYNSFKKDDAESPNCKESLVVKNIAKDISESMYPYLEIGASDYTKKSREKLVKIVESKLDGNNYFVDKLK